MSPSEPPQGKRIQLWAEDKDFHRLHVCSLLNALGQALGTVSVFSSLLFNREGV